MGIGFNPTTNLLRRYLTVARAIAVLLALFFSHFSSAQSELVDSSDTSPSFKSQVQTELDMQTLKKENQRCMRCHKVVRKRSNTQAITSVGAHQSKAFFDNCTACHGNKNRHPRDNAAIVSFSKHSSMAILPQNEQCLACHLPPQLRQAEWSHDVHYTQLNCASCHRLHQPQDPIIGIKPKSRVKLCVDCHRSQQTNKTIKEQP